MRKYLVVALIALMTVILAFAPITASPAKAAALQGSQMSRIPDLQIQKLPDSLAAASRDLDLASLIKPSARKPAPPSTLANKWAVVIGIADYSGSDSDLWHPDEDASEMAKALINNYGFASERVKILLNRKATAAAILAAIDWLVQNENAASSVVFFYSGHGFRVEDSRIFDSDIEADGNDEGIVSYDLYGLPDKLLAQRLAGLESSKVALLFGSCHSGGLFDEADELQGNGRVIATACKADQYGWDYLTLGNTLWGKFFVDNGLLQKGADLNHDGFVSIEEAHNFTAPQVSAIQADSEPQISDGYLTGELIP